MIHLNVNTMSESEKKAMMQKVRHITIPMYASGLVAYALFNWVRSAGGMILPGMIEDYSWNPGQAALFTAIFTYVYAFANLPTGMMVDIMGSRWMMTLSYVFITIGSFLFAFTDNYTLILIGRGMTAIGGSAVYAGISKCIAAWETAETYAGMNGKVQAASKVGAVLAATPLAWMLAGFGRNNTMMIIGAVALLISISLFLFIKDKPSDIGVLTIPELKGIGKPEQQKEGNAFKGIGAVLIQPQVWILIVATLGINSTINTIITNWGPTIMTQGLGISTVDASYVVTLCNICMILGALCLGFSTKKLGSVKKALAISYILFGAVLLVMALFLDKLNLPLLFILYAMLGLGASYGIAALFAIGRNLVTNKFYGTCIGFVNFICWLFGSAVASQMWGLFIDETYSVGSFQKAIWFQVAIFAVALVCYFLLKNKPIAYLEKLGVDHTDDE